MSKDHIDRVAGELWFIFGEHTDNRSLVDVSDGEQDVFERIPRDKAERLIKLRADFLAAVRAEYEAPTPAERKQEAFKASFAGALERGVEAGEQAEAEACDRHTAHKNAIADGVPCPPDCFWCAARR